MQCQKFRRTKRTHVLEVASGACVCGRAIAPYAGSVTCLDMTPAMLSVGETDGGGKGAHPQYKFCDR